MALHLRPKILDMIPWVWVLRLVKHVKLRHLDLLLAIIHNFCLEGHCNLVYQSSKDNFLFPVNCCRGKFLGGIYLHPICKRENEAMKTQENLREKSVEEKNHGAKKERFR